MGISNHRLALISWKKFCSLSRERYCHGINHVIKVSNLRLSKDYQSFLKACTEAMQINYLLAAAIFISFSFQVYNTSLFTLQSCLGLDYSLTGNFLKEVKAIPAVENTILFYSNLVML